MPYAISIYRYHIHIHIDWDGVHVCIEATGMRTQQTTDFPDVLTEKITFLHFF